MKLKKDEVLVLRDVHADMTSHGGFVWPEKGYVAAPDWNTEPVCGHGLHGHLWGAGGSYFISSGEGKYLVVRVNIADIVDLGDKVKFRCGYVVFCGSLDGAVKIIAKHAPANTAVNWSTQTAGDESTQTAGSWSTQTAGSWSTQTAGNKSTQTAGYKSTQTAGDESTQTAGDESTQTAGSWSTQTAGNWSTQEAGVNSVQIQRWFDGEWRVACRIVTEKEAGKPYCCNKGKWIEAQGWEQ